MKRLKSLEFKNKPLFIILSVIWLLALVNIGFRDRIGIGAFLVTSLIAVFALMTIRLDSEEESAAMLLILPVNLIISYLVAAIACLIAGEFGMAALDLGILLIVGGGSILGILSLYKKKEKQNMTWDNATLGKQNYSQEVWEKKQEKSYGTARRTVVMIQLFTVFKKQILILAFLTLGIACGLHAIETSEAVVCKIDSLKLLDKVIMPYGVFVFALFVLTGFWGAFSYKRLEITCLHLGHELEGARSVNAAASDAYNGAYYTSSDSDVPVMNAYGLFERITALANAYLCKYGKKPVNTIPFKWLSRILIAVHILAAVGVLAYSYI